MKLAYLSNIAAPHQVKFCYALQDYFDAKFFFYDYIGNRAEWWKTDLGDKCKIIDGVLFKKSGRYLTFNHLAELKKFNPDIVVLGGFSLPSNIIAYIWCRIKKKKTIVFTERSRNKKGQLRKYGLYWRLIRWIYRNIDLIIVSVDDASEQFRDTFNFGNRVVVGRYASDIDAYFNHPQRIKKDAYIYLFPNRLTAIYNPILAIEIFADITKKYPGSILKMNATGELKDACIQKINQLSLQNSIQFLTDIKAWDDLPLVYKNADIMILPATFSNGNFTIVEAMASGMGIVISNKVLGYGKLIEHSVNGFNCEPTREEFIQCIEEYIKHPELFNIHMLINRPKVMPLGAKGTAADFAEIINNNLFHK